MDGSLVPPGIIFSASSGEVYDTWVRDVDSKYHTCHFASSPNGWTTDEIGLPWVEQVFDRHTKQKARQGRDYRLLILDAHGSHVNMKFLEYCHTHRILVAVLPPHSTHRLQPLDVSFWAVKSVLLTGTK